MNFSTHHNVTLYSSLDDKPFNGRYLLQIISCIYVNVTNEKSFTRLKPLHLPYISLILSPSAVACMQTFLLKCGSPLLIVTSPNIFIRWLTKNIIKLKIVESSVYTLTKNTVHSTILFTRNTLEIHGHGGIYMNTIMLTRLA